MNNIRTLDSFPPSHVTTIDMIKYGFNGQVLGVYVTVEDDHYRGKYWVTSFLIEPVGCKFKKLETPEGLMLNATYYLPFAHIDACLDALEEAQERGRGGPVTCI